MPNDIQIVECPRDAMQGIHAPIPTQLKADYINQLLQVGFHTIDFGSFVSPKAVPQMADTLEVLAALDLSQSKSKLSAVVANLRGAREACKQPEIHYLGYPFSISETFQQRNTRKSISASMELVSQVQELCQQHQKELLIYISMAFGNPYGDEWQVEIAEDWVGKMVELGIGTIAMADTIGVATPENTQKLFASLIAHFPHTTFGAHFHSHPTSRREKLLAAYDGGCRRFDVALHGFGGCPFAKDELVGNIATESLLSFCKEKNLELSIDREALARASQLALRVFG